MSSLREETQRLKRVPVLVAILALGVLAVAGCSSKKATSGANKSNHTVVKIAAVVASKPYQFLTPVEKAPGSSQNGSPYQSASPTQGPLYFRLRGSINEWNVVIASERNVRFVIEVTLTTGEHTAVITEKSVTTDNNGEAWIRIKATAEGAKSTIEAR